MSSKAEPDLEAVLARAYSVISQPGDAVDLLEELAQVGREAGALGETAEMHFSNAADILENVYPNDQVDYGTLDTQPSDRPNCDLALDRNFRVVFANPMVFEKHVPAKNEAAPEWLFDPATYSADRERMKALEEQKDGEFIRLFTDPDDESGRWFTVRAARARERNVIAFDAVRLRWSERSGKAFREALNLTETEIALVKHMVGGGTVRQFADLRGRSLGTARNQLKALQRKLSINSKEDLLLLYAGFLHSLELPPESVWVDVHRCQNLWQSGDGQVIGWEEYGDPSGAPVLFFHPIEGALLTEPLAQIAAENGLRIIVPWRPFHGDTTGTVQGHKTPEDFADRLPGFLDHLDVDQCTAVTTHAGAPYMFAFAQGHPARLKAAVGLGAFVPIYDAEGMVMLRKAHRKQLRLVRIAPAFAKIYMRAMLATIGTGEFHRFVQEFYQGCERELASMQSPAMVSLLRSSASYVVRGRFTGLVDTMLNWAADWSPLCRNIQVPVHMIYGSEDATTSAELAHKACDAFGFAEPEFVPDAGSFLLLDQPEIAWARVRAIAAE
ncbi:hypothetical protein ACFCW2_02665 [Qipengyuania sp. DSG2-2]|uniref:hypothetical protein n=1 Tax=Qipengyuania sp. DGS2-2 TaxID=3349631 RepID=UPI0036D32C6F